MPAGAKEAGKTASAGPLAGVRVLDFCHFLAGPYATLALAEMGADVIKVEDLDHLDSARGVGPHFLGEQSLYFASLNWGKRSIGIRRAAAGGHELILDLVRSADVVVDNYLPAVMAKIGLDYESLRQVKPDIICCSLSGFGATGPYSERAAYDYTVQALTGVMSLTGDPDDPPGKAGISYVDHSGGLAAALAVCAALFERSRTGKGRYIDLGLLDVQVSMLSYLAGWRLNAGTEPARVAGGAHPTLVPAQLFETADGHISVFVGNDPMWRRLVEILDEPRLLHPDYATNKGRLGRRDELLGILQSCFARRSSEEWNHRLAAQRVPCSPVNSIGAALENEQVRARRLVASCSHPGYGTYEHVRGPVPALRDDEISERAAPVLGQNTVEILEELGYGSGRIADLLEQKVIAA